MNEISFRPKNDKYILYFTIPIVILVVICSSTGIWYDKLYLSETVSWLSQCIGQDISNLFFISPILLISSFYASKGNKLSKIIWIGTMMNNIYSYVIYCYAVHFNFLFLVYCLILGLTIFSVLNFFIQNINEDFKSWFSEKVPTKTIGSFLSIIAFMFTFLWLSNVLPAILNNTVPKNIIDDNLITNPVHVLDFSLFLPLMFISSVMLIKKIVLGYLIAPMMLIFAVLTNVNIICLTVVTNQRTFSSSTPMIIGFCIFTFVCLGFLWFYLKNILHSSKND